MLARFATPLVAIKNSDDYLLRLPLTQQ